MNLGTYNNGKFNERDALTFYIKEHCTEHADMSTACIFCFEKNDVFIIFLNFRFYLSIKILELLFVEN